MSPNSSRLIRTGVVLALSTIAFAQDPSQAPPPSDPSQQQGPSHGGWRRADQVPPDNQSAQLQDRNAPADPGFAQSEARDQFGSPVRGGQQKPPQGGGFAPPPSAPPSQLLMKAGTFITVRVDQPLSSDHNQPGDAFSATLEKPIVIDGIVVAQPGQTIAGRVAEAQKAGRVSGVSRLGVQLTELTLVDGQQIPIQSQLINRRGSTSVGRDVGAVAGTTALGAAVGAAADWGRGAAIGAGAGAAAGLIGVLLTRGQPTVIFPEQVLTFRIEAPVNISTARAPGAFQYVDVNGYDRPYDAQGPPPRPAGPPSAYYGSGAYGGYGGYPYPAPYFFAPGFYGPSFGFVYGSGFGRGFYGRGFYRRGSFRSFRR
jgi:hypothetical protein